MTSTAAVPASGTARAHDDPESAAHLEDQLRTLTRDRTSPVEELSGWYQGLPRAERHRHEDFIRRCTLEGLSTEAEPVGEDGR